jgi:hypothetical protein
MSLGCGIGMELLPAENKGKNSSSFYLYKWKDLDSKIP